MSCPNANANTTDCPAANSDFDFSGYLNTCRVCVAGNADVAGLGIITGVILQAALMNVYVLLWWGLGPGFCMMRNDFVDTSRWCCGASCAVLCRPGSVWANLKVARTSLQEDFDSFGDGIKAAADAADDHQEDFQEVLPSTIGMDNLPTIRPEGHGAAAVDHLSESDVDIMSSSRKNRQILQKIFRAFSDTQAVTGIALLLAALVQGDCLSLYHTAILIDLISISADGQAIMLFYAYKNCSTNNRFALLRTDRGIRLRLVSSALFVILYFVFAFKEYFRYRDSEECFLFAKPATGTNAGAWGISTAILVLVVYFPIFLPRRCHEWIIKSGGTVMNRTFASLYHSDSGEAADAEGGPSPKKGLLNKLVRLLFGLRRILAWMIYVVGKVVQWLYQRELSFPVGTWIYFLWNAISVGSLKQTNAVLLVGGGEEEQNFGAFGQIVPIVMAAALAFPIYDVLQEYNIPETDNNI